MKPVATARVVSTAPDFREEIATGQHLLVSDEPPALGGHDAGPAPYDLVLAGLGSCTAITLRMYARKKGWDIGHITVELALTKSAAGDTHIARVITTDVALGDEQWTKLLEIAGKTPVTKTLMAGATIESRRG